MNIRKMVSGIWTKLTGSKPERTSAIPFNGVWVDKRLVRQHRWRAQHGLPYSNRVASVRI